jgi:hypothetical protein
MAIALVQTKSGNAGNYANTDAQTFTSNVTVGSLLVMCITSGAADTIASVADTRGNTWTLVSAAASADRSTWLYYAANAVAGATTVTVTYTSGQNPDSAMIIREYSGVATTSPLDVSAVGNDGTAYNQAHSTAATSTTTGASDLVVVAGGVSAASPTYAAGSGYGNLVSQAGFDLYTSSVMEDQILTAAGAQTGAYSTTSYVRGEAIVAAFKAASAGGSTKTQTGVTRIYNPPHAVQYGTTRISGGVYSGPSLVWSSPMNNASDFTQIDTGAGESATINSSLNGYIGSSFRIVVNTTSSINGARKTLPNNSANAYQFRIKIATGATLSTSVNSILARLWGDAIYGVPFLDVCAIGVSGGWNLRTNEPQNANTTTTGSTLLKFGQWYRLIVSVTATGYQLYVETAVTAEINLTGRTNVPAMAAISLGKWNSTGMSGTIDYDDIMAIKQGSAAATTFAQQQADTWFGWKQTYLSLSGAIVRPYLEGNNAAYSATAVDVVSEGMGYGLRLAVQNNDQASAILMDNWVVQNLLRSNSTLANSQSNGAPTNALNLMGFHYNPTNADGKGPMTFYDANWAFDGDIDRCQGLLWAHARYGSSAYTVGSTNELITPNWLQRATNVFTDLRTYAFVNSSGTGYNYAVADAFQQGNATVNIGPDYNRPAAFRLIKGYDTGNTTFWDNAVLGAYDLLTKAANAIYTASNNSVPAAESTTAKLNPDWVLFTVSTAAVSTATLSSYGDTDYGYNAFRTYNEAYNDYIFYGGTTAANALTFLQLSKSFFVAEWATSRTGSPLIYATYNHDGHIQSGGNYESNLFYWPDFWTIYANDNANTTATAIYTNKLSGGYKYSPVGSHWTVSPGSDTYSYFGSSWMNETNMMYNGTWLNYLAPTTRTSTTTGTTRILNVRSTTQTGTTRIQKVFTKLQNGITRVQTSRSFTQLGLTRIQKPISVTIVGISRIVGTRTKTQTGTARIVKTLTNTQTGISRVQSALTKTQTGVMRILNASSFIKTQTGTARISKSASATQTGKSRIQATFTKTITGVSRIQVIFTKTQTGVTRISNARTATQTGLTRIVNSSTKTQPGTARITATLFKLQTGTVRVAKTLTKTITGISRVQITFTKTQAGVTRVQKINTATQTGTAHIFSNNVARTATQPGTARIQNGRNTTISGTVRIQAPIVNVFERITTVQVVQGTPITLPVTQGTPINIYITP